MAVTEDAWYEEANATLPRAVCIAGEGCSVGTSANKPVYVVAVNNNDMTVNLHHAIDAELLDTSLKPADTTWENWKFFQ